MLACILLFILFCIGIAISDICYRSQRVSDCEYNQRYINHSRKGYETMKRDR